MIKEIEEIAKEMIALNNQVYGTIIPTEELYILKKNLITIKSIQKNINRLLIESSFFSATDKDQIIVILIKIHQLLSQLAITIENIATLMNKFVCDYDKKWNIVQKNIA
jgi:hypothetical protein